jgi:hypothetical protein
MVEERSLQIAIQACAWDVASEIRKPYVPNTPVSIFFTMLDPFNHIESSQQKNYLNYRLITCRKEDSMNKIFSIIED